MSNEKLVKLIFLIHCVVALMGHLFVVIMPIGLIQLILNNYMDFWTKGLILGCLYMGMIYTINHISSGDFGFCILTNLENFYRQKAGLPLLTSNRFLPRFYKVLFPWLKRNIKK